MSSIPPVTDWMTDFDHRAPRWIEDPFSLWRDMRRTGEVARTGRHGGVFFPLTWAAIRTVASTPERFSSRHVVIRDAQTLPPDFAPPITTDPPDHRAARARIAQAFFNTRIKALEGEARAGCRALTADVPIPGIIDAVSAYGEPAVARIIARLLGLRTDDVIAFQPWGIQRRLDLIRSLITEKRATPGEDLVSDLIRSTDADDRSGEARLVGHIYLLLVAGVETTVGVISSGLLHLADDAHDQSRLRAEPRLIPVAVEEFLRAFAPVSTARVAKAGAAIAGCPVADGKMILLSFAAANRDPARFPDPDRVVIDRDDNRHAAFGFGAHHCVGASLARMLIRVAIEEWLDAVPAFSRDERVPLEWLPDSVRALRRLPLHLHPAAA